MKHIQHTTRLLLGQVYRSIPFQTYYSHLPTWWHGEWLTWTKTAQHWVPGSTKWHCKAHRPFWASSFTNSCQNATKWNLQSYCCKNHLLCYGETYDCLVCTMASSSALFSCLFSLCWISSAWRPCCRGFQLSDRSPVAHLVPGPKFIL